MSVIEQQGDLFDAEQPVLAHGCNCAGVMGKGIALEFRRRWPDMFDEYRLRCRRGEFTPGDLFAWVGNDRIILNLGTQLSWRSKATPDAVRAAVEQMVDYSRLNHIDSIAMPRIAAGLGGLEWSDVRAILNDAIPDSLTVVVYSLEN